MQNFSYHTHTNFSDGSNTLEEMLEQAVRLGWSEIGISDHLIVHKNIKKGPSAEEFCNSSHSYIYHDDFNKALEKFQRRAEDFRRIAAGFPLKVYLGYEVDYFTYDGWEDEFREFIAKIDHDYLITGNHILLSEDGMMLYDIWRIEKANPPLPEDQIYAYFKRHYETIEKAVRSGLFVFLAHLDYARKAKVHQKFPLIEERLKVVKALAETGVACEVSTKGLRKIGDYYPQKIILDELIKQKVPLVISDDAHNVNELGYAFDQAEKDLSLYPDVKRFKLNLCL